MNPGRGNLQNHRVVRGLARAAVGLLLVSLARPSRGDGPVVLLPPNVLLPNPESLPVGAVGGLEGNAFTARVSNSDASWFNPAGLAGSGGSSASVSAGTLRFVSVEPEGAESHSSAVDVLPAAVGFLIKKPFGNENWTVGFALTRTAAWRQETDFRFVKPGDLRERTTLAGDAEFDRTTVGINAGYSNGGAWRFGGGILCDVLTLRNVQSLSFRRETGSHVETLVASNRASAGQGSLRLGLGVQADISEEVKFGAVLRTPGVQIVPSGSFSADFVYQRGAASVQASFFDGETTDFEYRLPFEGTLGLAWVTSAFELEVDVKAQSAVSRYDGFSSPSSVVFIEDAGDGSGARVTLTPFPGRAFSGRSIVNVSAGGHVNLDRRGIWKVHAGYATDRSPVGDEDEFFDRIDLNSVSLGVSGSAHKIAGSLGVTYQFGTSGERAVPDLVGGTLAYTKFKIENWGVLYSFSYAF